MVNAALASGHQGVKVRASDKGRARAERNRGSDVCTRTDASVEKHLGSTRELIDNSRKKLERRDGSVELPSAVIRERQPVRTGVNDRQRIVDPLHSFDDERPSPFRTQPFEDHAASRMDRTRG